MAGVDHLDGSISQPDPHQQSSDELVSGMGFRVSFAASACSAGEANARRRLRSVPTAKVASSAALVS